MNETILNRLPQLKQTYTDICERIKSDPTPLYLYGCGAYAISVFNACTQNGIVITGVFVDDSECLPASFKGYTVKSINEVLINETKISIIIGFSKFTYAVNKLKQYQGSYNNIYCLCSAVYGNPRRLGKAFFDENNCRCLNSLYEKLEDDKSAKALDSYLLSRYTDNYEYCIDSWKDADGYFKSDILKLGTQECFLDIGANDGKNIFDFIDTVQARYDNIIALEPDTANRNRLKENINAKKLHDIYIEDLALCDKSGVFSLRGVGEQTVITKDVSDSNNVVSVVTLNELVAMKPAYSDISLMVAAFPNTASIISGGRAFIKERHPKLIFHIGFSETDMIDVPKAIISVDSGYKLYLRYVYEIPQGLVLYAI